MSYHFFKCVDAYGFFLYIYIKHIFIMMDKYFNVSNMLFFDKSNFIFLKKKKERCDFITKHLTDFAMLYVSSLVLTR